MKNIIIALLLFTYLPSFSQIKAPNQKQRLSQYIGNWYSTDKIDDKNLGVAPNLNVVVKPMQNENSIQVEVFENKRGKWDLTLVELISYDSKTDQIVALGQNKAAECFIGKGYFDTSNIWKMQDFYLNGEPSLSVTFNFLSGSEILLKGMNPDNTASWEVKYIKSNPKDKNIGIQLVSVKDKMEKDPVKTIQELSRMGYSYLETFVYADRKFYGMKPAEFRKLVEDNNMKFLGSMTFKNLPENSNWAETMNWWEVCIQDHLDAGVEYITTSNNELKKIKTLKELKKYCDYYNTVGKLCKQKGIIFGFHNHADEFGKIEGETIYDFLLKNTNPEYVHFQMDLYWIKKGGADPISYFNKYPNRFFSWHIKDEKELGKSGEMDFGNIFKYTKKAGIKYNIAEVEQYNFDPLVSVEMAYRYLYSFDFEKK